MITEPDVALTDWALALLAGGWAWRLGRRAPPGPLRPWLVLFFAAAAVAALLGGLVHGLFLDPRTLGARVLWPATLLAVGLTAVAAWGLGARLALPGRAARALTAAAVLVFAGYGVAVVWRPAFALAVAHYLPAAVFLLAVLVRRWRRTGEREAGLAALGLSVILVGSAAQGRGWALHPVYFTANAVYHVIETVGLGLVFAGGRRLGARGLR